MLYMYNNYTNWIVLFVYDSSVEAVNRKWLVKQTKL